MHKQFKINAIYASICVALACQAASVQAATSPYPALPPTLSTAVTPNIMLLIDNSASMLQDQNNNWLRSDLCPNPASNWSTCINNNAYHAWEETLDDEATSPLTKMNIAKSVARDLIDKNKGLRFGIASFEVRDTTTIGGSERGEAAVIVSNILQPSLTTGGVSNQTLLNNAIGSLRARTATPLGEALLEVTRYYEGKPSLYSKITGSYTSPIQYRCQKNFTIVLTDGDSSNDDNLPGNGQSALAYTSYNAAGTSQSKSFSVCTATGTDCPASLEGSSATPGFGTNTSRFRAIRDVAKYANDMDMKTSGNDLDTKSFNDPKFPEQNMQTYTVAFGLANDVLPATATVGGGKTYTASSGTELSAALTNAVASIVASASNAGGVAVTSDYATNGNYVFQPVFNPGGWFGELRRYTLTSAGNFDLTTLLEANARLKVRSAARVIYSSKVDSTTTTPFDFNDSTGFTAMSSAQKLLLGATATEQKNTINSLRGVNVAGLRDRTDNKLGDIVDSQPVVVTVPNGYTNDSTYTIYKTSNASRGIVFVGSNDGMMHGFNIASMDEVLGYVPASVYPNLKPVTSAQYGSSVPHSFNVNGPAKQADIRTGTTWRTLLVGGLGQGGQGYFALDVSKEANFSSPANTVKWEWSEAKDKAMGYSFGTPIIYNVRQKSNVIAPAVIMTNGYESSFANSTDTTQNDSANSSALFIVNAEDGKLIRKILVPSSGGTPSTGLSSPAGVDYGQDGIIDYVYAGDVNGNMWRFDLTASDPDNYTVTSQPIFTAKAANGTAQPITMRPAIQAITDADGAAYGNVVIFGTGKLLTDTDRTDTSTQTLYGVLDKLAAAPTTITRGGLLEQTVLSTGSVSDVTKRTGNYRRVSDNPISLKNRAEAKLGWFLDLPVSTERLVTSPMLYEDRVFFGTGVTQSNEQCLAGGKGWIMGLNPVTGGVIKDKKDRPFSFVDVTKDGKSTTTDMVNFGGTNAYVSGFELDGIPTELSFIQSRRVITSPTVPNGGGGAGSAVALTEANAMAVYTGNILNPTSSSAGEPIPRPASKGDGKLIHCKLGSDNCDTTDSLPAPAGVRVIPVNFREITKQ